MNVAQRLAKTLVELGVQYVFGVPSGNFVEYGEAIREAEGIEFVLVSNEASGGFMADAHWRLTGRVAASFGTYGPGACNLSAGICSGFLDRSPMIALADEMSDAMLHRAAQMNIDHQAFFKPISKLQMRLRPDRVRETLYQAFEVATAERPGPVYIGLPTGLALEESKEERVGLKRQERDPHPDQKLLKRMKEIFQRAHKPILAVGLTSVRAAGAASLIKAIAEKFAIPVVQTPMAKGSIPEDHQCYAGVLAHALANQVGETHRQADLVVGIGYDPIEINYEEWIPDAPLLHIDTLPADLDKRRFSLALDVVGDIEHSLKELLKLEERRKGWDLEALAQRREEMFRRLEPKEGLFDARSALARLRDILPLDGIMVCDVGAHLHLIGQQWKTPAPQCQMMTNGCSSMGFGIPAAIAAKISCRKREVCCVVGDGGFLMMAGEILTALRCKTKVVFVLLADKALSLIHRKQRQRGYQPYGVDLYSEDFLAADTFLGAPVLCAHTTEEYEEALEKAFAFHGPIIVEAFINREAYDDLILKGNT